MPVRLDVKGKDVVDLVDRLGQCIDWLISKNVHMYVWKTEFTIEKLQKAKNELQDGLISAKENLEDAERNGWRRLINKQLVVGWIREGWVCIDLASGVVENYQKLMADPTGCVLLSRRKLNCRAIRRLNDILEHKHEGKIYYEPWSQWPQQDNREQPLPSSDDCARKEAFGIPSSNEQNLQSLAPSGIQKMKLSGLAEYHAIPRAESLDRVPVMIMIRVNAPAYTRRSRAAVDLVMVLDARTSMSKNGKLDQLKQGCMFVILNLEARDRLSIVTFGETTKELLPLTSMTTQGKKLANELVRSLQAGGSTTAESAMDSAYEILDRRQDRKPVSSVLLLTDGKCKSIFNGSLSSANGDVPPEKRKYPTLPPKRGKYPTYTFGFGLDHDPRALYYLATSGYGTYSYVTDNKSIRDAMALCIGGLTSIVAQDVKITIQPAREDVEIQILGTPDDDPRRVASGGTSGSAIDVKDLCASEEKKFIVYVKVPREEAAAAIFPAGTPKTKLLSVTATYYCPLKRTQESTDTMVVSVERPRMLQTRDRGISVEVAGEVTRADMFNRVEKEWRRSIIHRTEDYSSMNLNLRVALFGKLSVKLNDLKKSIDSTEEAHAAGERWDDLVMDLENMTTDISDIDRIDTWIDLYSSCITGLPYMLSWLSSHRWQRAATPGSISKSRWFHFRTTRMQNMIDSVDKAPISGCSDQ